MINYFAGKSIAWLIERRDALQETLGSGGGSQTGVAISPGMSHQFKGATLAELEEQLLRVLYALWLLDPVTYENPATPNMTRIVYSR